MSEQAINLSRLIEMAREVKMSAAQKHEQRNSFVYGNTRTENQEITRDMVERIALALSDEQPVDREGRHAP